MGRRLWLASFLPSHSSQRARWMGHPSGCAGGRETKSGSPSRMTATVVRIVARRRRRTPGAKARMFAGVERAKAEALAYLEASTATWHA